MRIDGGDSTFLANHSDFIGSVDICVVRIQMGESTPLDEVRAAAHGGFVKVAGNKVTIVAGVAELADEIDVERARRALEAAEARGAGAPVAQGGAVAGEVESATLPEEESESDAAVAAARARVRLAAASASGSEVSGT